MCIFWKSNSKSSCSKNLNWYRTYPLFCPHDMSNLHHIIIYNDCTMVCRIDTVRLQEYCIIYLIRIELNTTTNNIVKYNFLIFWNLKSYGKFLAIRDTFSGFLEWEVTTMSIIPWWELEFFLLSTECCKSLWGTETIIGSSLLAHLVKSWSIGIYTFWLNIWSIFTTMTNTLIRRESEDIMCIENPLNCTLDEASSICILYTYDILSLIMVCP